VKDGHFGGQSATQTYTAQDVRFTRSVDGKTIFVFLLGQPKAGSKITIKHLADGIDGVVIKDVDCLGSDKKPFWVFEDGVMTVTAPAATKSNEIATVFKVSIIK